tara:strand:- start:4 stop:246 length:243 start_codon:yes stop_codon:yes gene_type:complete
MFEEKCTISKYLAYGMLAYTFASIYYMIMTRNIGTPFKNSLSPEQLQIKVEAASLRGSIFYQGIGLAVVLIFLFKPFEEC